MDKTVIEEIEAPAAERSDRPDEFERVTTTRGGKPVAFCGRLLFYASADAEVYVVYATYQTRRGNLALVTETVTETVSSKVLAGVFGSLAELRASGLCPESVVEGTAAALEAPEPELLDI